MTTQLNPDCEAGKHQACTGLGWDVLNDEPDDCRCACHDVKGARSREHSDDCDNPESMCEDCLSYASDDHDRKEV